MAGVDADALEHAIRQPGIEGADFWLEAGQQLVDGAAEIAEADEADIGARQQFGLVIAVEAVEFVARDEIAMRGVDAASKRQRHAEPDLGDRCGEHRARRDDMDAALEAGLVIDIRQEIGLDIDDAAQFRREVEPRRSPSAAG